MPIYPQKQRNTCSFNNIDKLNSDLNNLTKNENNNNNAKNNVELISTSFLIAKENMHFIQKIIYHKKKIESKFY